MSKSKHTPGPWAVGGSEGMQIYYLNPRIEAGDEDIDDPSHDGVIAKCDDMGPWSGIPDDARRANARLIAAAPDLLAACKKAIEFWHSDHPNDTYEAQAAKKFIEAAIAKAEGAIP